jgi:hypothetical protein
VEIGCFNFDATLRRDDWTHLPKSGSACLLWVGHRVSGFSSCFAGLGTLIYEESPPTKILWIPVFGLVDKPVFLKGSYQTHWI